MPRALKWWLLALALPVHVVVLLAVTGVPRPPALTVEGVGRVGWTPLLEDAARLWAGRHARSLVTWMPDGSGVLVQGRRLLFDTRLHTLARPGGDAVFLPAIPRNATVRTRFGKPYVVLAWDLDGDEQYRLFRWDLGGEPPVPLTDGPERATFGAFEPDGHRIAYASTRRNGRDADIYVMDVMDHGSDERVLEAGGTWGVAGWSPVADELLVVKVTSNLANELYILDLATRALRRLETGAEGSVRHGSAQWSPDGRALYYASDGGAEFMHLRRLDLPTGRETVLTAALPWDVTGVQQSGDGGTLLLSVNEGGRTRHYTTGPMGEDPRPLDLFPAGQLTALLHPEEPLVLVNHTDEDGVVRGYTWNLRTEELIRWVGPEAAASDAPAPRLIEYPTFDSVDGAPRHIPAFVYPGLGEGPHPVLVSIHGGPESQALLRTGVSAAQRDGITLITPNVRGSTGYGRTYTTLDDWYLREDAVRDIGALLDWIRTQPDLDAERVAVTGGSYGGYMVLASLVHYSPRLRCGIDIVGISDFVTFLENTADYRRDLRRAEYGDERIPEMRAFLDSIAPLTSAERITSPLMVVQGANDPRVPVTESRQLVERVRDGGLDVSYIEGANEGHGFRDPWNSLWAGLAQRQLTRECLHGG
ncbi:MAG TPA: alpha/beta fold hydrolase [Longimicrobiales bacterium]|jgi:dipeptidyl aminopeptidase/acylaminoacyl peptidase